MAEVSERIRRELEFGARNASPEARHLHRLRAVAAERGIDITADLRAIERVVERMERKLDPERPR